MYLNHFHKCKLCFSFVFFYAFCCYFWDCSSDSDNTDLLSTINFEDLFSYRYHVPRSWLKPTDNLLVIFDDKGGDPTQIRFVKRKVTSVCGFISEEHPSPVKYWKKTITKSVQLENMGKPSVHLQCPEGSQISSIKFASFGSPQGSCGTFQKGSCHGIQSSSIVEKVISITSICLL